MTENKRKNINWSLIIIIILLMAVSSLATYIVVDKTNKENNKQKIEETKEKENAEIGQEKAEELEQSEIEALKEKIEKISYVFSSKYPITSIDALTNQELLWAMRSLSSVNSGNFSAEELDKQMTKYFGNSKKLKHEDMICTIDNVAMYIYNDSTNTYNFNDNHPGHGGTIGVSRIKVYDAKVVNKEGNKVTITAKLLYGNYCSDICMPGYAYYASYPREGAVKLFESEGPEEFIITDEKYNEVASQIPITTFTFEKESDGNYGIKTVYLQ